MTIEINRVYEGEGASSNYVISVINDCVIFIRYSSSHKTYDIDYMLLEKFINYYPNKLDTYYNEDFEQEVTYKKLRG